MTDTDRGIDDVRHLPWEAKQSLPRKPKRAPVPLLTVLLLEPHHCRWPLGTDPYHFCGEPKAEGRPYCVDHTRIAYHKGLRT